MPERDIEKYFNDCVRKRGGEVRKMKWIGRAHAPDRFAMIPLGASGRHVFVELKAPGKSATDGQAREHDRMRGYGCDVLVLDTIKKINAFFRNHDKGYWNR